jgi:glutamate-5-semialdehyde dehydrogenase
MDATAIISELALKARAASRSLSTATGEQRSRALLGIADEIDKSSDFILAANAEDMARAKSENMHPQTQDRLLLTAERIKGISSGVRQVAALENPLGKIIREKDLENGLHLEQRTVPFGVVGMVYEARPNVSVDAAVI